MEKNTVNLDELFSRGVGEFIDPDGAFRKKLQTEPQKIIIKFGVDPTRPDIHLGHAVVLRKLRQFQDLGCKVIFLVGDLTAQIGDPTGKSKIRPEIDQQEVERNMKTYLDQVGKILKTDAAVFSWIKNSDWFVSVNDIIAPDKRSITVTAGTEKVVTPLLPANDILNKAEFWIETRMQKGNVNSYSLINVISIMRHITFNRLIERDMFQDRLKNGEPVFMHEMLYPIIQGIDSNVLANIYGTCDMEVGGTDQHFNMLMGREIMEINGKKPQAVVSFKILEGTDGKEKMSKSLDNYIGIIDAPNDMYGKILSIPDTSILSYFELCTYTPLARIEEMKQELAGQKVNPKDLKMELARQIVTEYYGSAAAEKAEEDFVAKFQKKTAPADAKEYTVATVSEIPDLFVKEGIVASKTEFRRFLSGNSITNLEGNTKINELEDFVSGTYKIGSHTFIKLVIEN